MRSIIEYGIAGWLSFNVLFVIAWARFHAARQRYEHQRKATVIVFRPNSNLVCSQAFEESLKKTS